MTSDALLPTSFLLPVSCFLFLFLMGDLNKCPCGEEVNCDWIQDDKCLQWWHVDCVNLKGLKTKQVKMLECWACPRCLVSPHQLVMNGTNTDEPVTKGDITAVYKMIKESMNALTHTVVDTTPEIVQKMEEKTKSWADIVAENQKKLLDDVKSQSTSVQLVEKICQKMDSDNFQRERRKLNILVSNVPEPKALLTPKEKKEADIDYMCQNFGMKKNEILTCFRTGAVKTDDNGNSTPRPIVAKMLDIETAEYWHDYGKGYKIGDSWINPDLCKVDRDQQFFARQERRRRKSEKEAKASTPK